MSIMQNDESGRQIFAGFLDEDGPDMVRLSEAQASALAIKALGRIGFTEQEAAIIADQLVNNALGGYRFAGLPRILAIAGDEKSRKDRYPIKVITETPVSAMIDGGNNVGYLTVSFATDLAIAKAKQIGIAIVGVYNTYFSGRNAYFVERMARAGLVGIHTGGTHPRVFPPGAAKPALGTNPLCIGFPTTADPVIYDIGTAAIQGGELELAAHIGALLPEGVGFDSEGHPTRDAREVRHGGIAPFGGHKGYGLSLAIQALGVLAGCKLARGNVIDYGFLLIAIDPAVLLPGGDFSEQMTEFVATIKATPRQPGVKEIRIPGERAVRERARRRTEGIVIEKKIIDSLNAL
jgi:LDH2 family malate/lactate/ureidoglycolate dehydrogenase